MLVLTRRIDESISIGDNVTIQVLRVDGGRVRIGIKAPRTVAVHRSELAEGPSRNNLFRPVATDISGGILELQTPA